MVNRKRRLPRERRTAPFTRFLTFGSLKKLRKTAPLRVQRINTFIEKRPLTSFFIALCLLFLAILLGSTIFSTRTPQQETKTSPKNVSVYSLGETPHINVQGQVTKKGVITIVAQAPGIVSGINVIEGKEVAQHKTLIDLSSNYQGGNAATLQRQLAGVTYQNTKETYDIQKGLIQRQRDLANRQSENAEELRELTRISIDETRTLVNLNAELLRGIQTAIQNAPAGTDISTLQASQAQLQAGQNQLQAGLRTSEYQVDESRPAVDLERIGRDIALAQLDLQEKALKLSLQAAGIQLQLAKVQEATMFPASPFSGIVQKVHVKKGEAVNPGTPLVTLAGFDGTIIVDAKVPQDIAQNVSQTRQATILVDGKEITVTPFYVSTEATTGQLYSVLFSLDESHSYLFTDSSFVTVKLPVGIISTGSVPFIPVDSVFQTQNEAYVFVVANGKAKSKNVKLGPVIGQYVTVEEGLSPNDRIILNRNVVDGDTVTVAR